jgi:hypothetical protein
MGFASAAGLSVYVTFTFILFLFIAALFWLVTRRFKIVGLYTAVAMLVVLLSAGYLRDLRATATQAEEATPASHAQATTKPPPFAILGLRQLPPTLGPALRHAVHDNKLANIILRPFVLIPIMALEFGFYFLVAVRQGRNDWRQRSIDVTAGSATRGLDPATPGLDDTRDTRDIRWLSWLMLASGLWVALMMRSTVISNNDLSYRGVEIAQFLLLMWGAAQLAGVSPQAHDAVPSWEQPTPRTYPPLPVGWLAGVLLFLGLVSSTYQLAMLRFYLYGSDRYGWTNPVIPQSEFGGRLGAINQQLRDAYASLDRILPPSAKVQFGTAPKLGLQFLYYSRYQQLDGMFPGCGTAFGGGNAQCFRLEERIAPLFGIPAPLPGTDPSAWRIIDVPTLKTTDAVQSLCRELGIDALVVTGEDPVWTEPNGWPRQMRPVFASDFVAAYTCR